MPEQKARFRKLLGWLSDARTLQWAVITVSGGVSALSALLLKASTFLAAMQPGLRVGVIICGAVILFGVLLVPLAIVARRIALKTGLETISAGHSPATLLAEPTRNPGPLPQPLGVLHSPAPQLSAEERSLVQDHRTVWLRSGRQAVNLLGNLFRETTEEIKRKEYLGRALDREVQHLKDSIGPMDRALADDSTASIAEVRESLAALYSAYLGAAGWLTDFEDNESDIIVGQRRDDLKQWQKAHRKWHDRLKDLDTIPAHRGTLRIYLTPSPGRDRDRLVREAESD